VAELGHRLVRLAVRGSADKVDKFDLGPITEAYDIELPAATARRPRCSSRWRSGRTRSTARSGPVQRRGAETIQILPVSPPATEA
jgi:hypothetical protein